MDDQLNSIFTDLERQKLEVGAEPFEYVAGGHTNIVIPFLFEEVRYVMYFQPVSDSEKDLFCQRFGHQMAKNSFSIKFGQARWFCQDNYVSRSVEGLGIDLSKGL